MADIAPISTDVVVVPRKLLDTIAEALASIVRVGGESFSLLVERLDQHYGDPDREDDDPAEHDGTDEGDQAWIEWQPRRHPLTTQVTCGPEDDEEDDPAEEDDPSGVCDEDGVNSARHSYGWFPTGAGCPIADPGGNDLGD